MDNVIGTGDKSREMGGRIHDDASKNPDNESFEETIKRYQGLFHYSYAEARDLAMRHRAHLTRQRISDAHWQNVKAEKEPEGYDKETYEYASQAGLIYHQGDHDNGARGSG